MGYQGLDRRIHRTNNTEQAMWLQLRYTAKERQLLGACVVDEFGKSVASWGLVASSLLPLVPTIGTKTGSFDGVLLEQGRHSVSIRRIDGERPLFLCTYGGEDENRSTATDYTATGLQRIQQSAA